MKKTKKFAKRHIVLAVMVFALGAAVWLNMQYATSNGGFDLAGNASKSLGDATFVANESDPAPVVQTNAQPDYFASARQDRSAAREEAVGLLQETIDDVKSSAEAKDAATAKIGEIAGRIEKEASIESLIKAKGFSEAVAVLSDDGANIVVRKDGDLLASETLQIQDIVVGETGLKLEQIKIVTVK